MFIDLQKKITTRIKMIENNIYSCVKPVVDVLIKLSVI